LQLKDISIAFKLGACGPHSEVCEAYLEPIDGAAVDQGWELPETIPEGVPNEAHGQDNMQLIAAPLHEHVEERDWSAVGLPGLVALPVKLTHLLTDLSFLVGRIEIGDLASVQQVVDVLQERLLLDLWWKHI
jgi:hypothetical protein